MRTLIVVVVAVISAALATKECGSTQDPISCDPEPSPCSSDLYNPYGKCGLAEHGYLRCQQGYWCSAYGYCGKEPKYQRNDLYRAERRPDHYPLQYGQAPNDVPENDEPEERCETQAVPPHPDHGDADAERYDEPVPGSYEQSDWNDSVTPQCEELVTPQYQEPVTPRSEDSEQSDYDDLAQARPPVDYTEGRGADYYEPGSTTGSYAPGPAPRPEPVAAYSTTAGRQVLYDDDGHGEDDAPYPTEPTPRYGADVAESSSRRPRTPYIAYNPAGRNKHVHAQSKEPYRPAPPAYGKPKETHRFSVTSFLSSRRYKEKQRKHKRKHGRDPDCDDRVCCGCF